VLSVAPDRLEAPSHWRACANASPATRPGTQVLPVSRVPDRTRSVLLVLRVDLEPLGRSGGRCPPIQTNDSEHHDHDHQDQQPRADANRWRSGLEGRFNRQRLGGDPARIRSSARPFSPQRSLQQPGKVRPCRIQAVGPRWECWYEAHPQAGVRPHRRDELAAGAELVALGCSSIELSWKLPCFYAQEQLRFC